MIKALSSLEGVVDHEENKRGQEGLYLDSLINDHFLAYVGGPRFVNPISYFLVNDVLSFCTGTAVEREQDLYIFTYW